MKKHAVIFNIYWVGGAILTICYGLALCQDYFVLYPHGSAPFSFYVIFRTIEFFVPVALCFVVGIIIKGRKVKE